MRPLLILALLSIAVPATAQVVVPPASPERDGGWFTFGLGPGDPYGTAATMTANVGRERFLQAGFHANSEFSFGGRSASTNALHVGAGLARVSRWDRTSISAGPAVVWGLRDAADPDARFTTGGVVLNGQAVFTPIPELGIGLDAFVNVNPVQSGYGVALTFVFEGNK